jgi:catalase
MASSNGHEPARAAPEDANASKVAMPSKTNNPKDRLTQNNGTPIESNRYSETVGQRGPVLLEDMHLVNKLAQFNREKTPERVVHARGYTAKGHFEVTDDISDLTCADLFSEVGKRTPVATRFSTVTHERGSPESLRDVRGFSVKFYTQQGNWDFVGNNIPVFFIRDGMAFPDLVHALRPNPKNHIQEGWRIMDFLAGYPESIHILTWLLDEPGIPQDWRHLEGYSVNTFTLVNQEGKRTWVKFNWYPDAGSKFMTDEQAQAAGEKNMRHSHATHDLYNAIAGGDFPSYTLKIQTLDPSQELDFDFDPLDCTKVWPTDVIPERTVGKMVLDQHIDNFHNESEQIAFSPGIVVPGITYSDDKLLQSRVNAYQDTQRYRLGVNYELLPINQPKCPFHINAEAGAMNFVHDDGEVNYWPSYKKEDSGYTASDSPTPNSSRTGDEVSGKRMKADYGDNGGKWDDFKQAGDRWRSMSAIRKGLFLKNLAPWLADPKAPQEVRDIWIDYFSRADGALGTELNLAVKAIQTGSGLKDKVTGRPTENAATVA